MDRDRTQSLLDGKFPHGANVIIQNGYGAPFNVPRFIVLNDTTIRCNPYGHRIEMTFEPEAIEERDDGTLVFHDATPNRYDVVVRPAPEAIHERLAAVRPSDLLIRQIRGDDE